MTHRRSAGANDWMNGQPTDSNPVYAGMRYIDGIGWCNPQGERIQNRNARLWNVEDRITSVETHSRENPNIPPGFKRVAMGVPCPIDGSEDGVVYYKVDGENAIWDDGDVYMRKE